MTKCIAEKSWSLVKLITGGLRWNLEHWFMRRPSNWQQSCTLIKGVWSTLLTLIEAMTSVFFKWIMGLWWTRISSRQGHQRNSCQKICKLIVTPVKNDTGPLKNSFAFQYDNEVWRIVKKNFQIFQDFEVHTGTRHYNFRKNYIILDSVWVAN